MQRADRSTRQDGRTADCRCMLGMLALCRVVTSRLYRGTVHLCNSQTGYTRHEGIFRDRAELMRPARKYDLLVLGATGFTGRLGIEYLHSRYGDVRWLATGRSAQKLSELRSELGLTESQTAICDVLDAAQLDTLVSESQAVLNFAGTPFVDKAIPVVDACVRHGTSYIDITGETALQRATMDAYHDKARESGALIVHQCGYDSVPSDLGAMLAATELRERFGCAAKELKTFAGPSKGGVSGGTLATVLMLLTTSEDKVPGAAAAKRLGSYALDPKEASPESRVDKTDFGGSLMGFDERIGKWHIPFVMAASNAPVVRKSAHLMGYGDKIRPTYAEVQAVPSRAAAIAGLAGLGVAGLALLLPPLRWLLFALKALPRPGEGPSKDARDNGFFHMYTLAVGVDKSSGPDEVERRVLAHVRSGDAGDPGYKGTARMASEAALCAALERPLCAEGGVLTPASAFGPTLVKRLRATGMVLETEVIGSDN